MIARSTRLAFTSGTRSRVLLFTIGSLLLGSLLATNLAAQSPESANPKHTDPYDAFAQLDPWWPTPGEDRIASGAPGPSYWQQRADYEIDITLDDEKQSLSGTLKLDYHNRSPHVLNYIWVQLDQNRFDPDSNSYASETAGGFSDRASFSSLQSIFAKKVFDGGFKISSVTDGKGKKLDSFEYDTMMRIDLPRPLMPGKSTRVVLEYSYNIVDSKTIRARSGKEYFESDENYIYEIAQWHPRVAAYTDYGAWQHKAFLGRGEFTLELGDYQVRITLPAEMVCSSTGTLQNPDEVLKPEWKERLAKAAKSKTPLFIVTPAEAKKNEAVRTKRTKTWEFHAKNVRDFAFAASRKFIWDAMGVQVGSKTVMAMSYYPNEAEPLWSQYSTESIAHTLEVYGRYCFEYPYEVAISVNGPVYGMEYPMICFNGPRPEKDGTYSKSTKYALISVVIHEVGHNFFPMIVNSDERQWTWMDEGLNTFLQYIAEQEWEENYPSRRGDPEKIVAYMRGGNQRPIMTGSEEILQFGNNAYAKPATALNILRETILGRERFDFAFREYSRRWMFKRPTPSDFFRTMEDASGVDLDWFWRGWFYSTKHVDIAIDDVKLYLIDSGDPDERAERQRLEKDAKEPTITESRNVDLPRRIDWQPGLKDYYNSPEYDPSKVTENDRKSFQRFLDSLDDEQRELLKRTTNFYLVDFSNQGGLVMPIIVDVHYDDQTRERMTFPAEIWRQNSKKASKLIVSDKEIVRLELDPQRQTADVEASNNHWPKRLIPSRFKLYKSSRGGNEMQRAKADKKKAEDEKKAAAAKQAAEAKKAAEENKPADEPKAAKKKVTDAKPAVDKQPAAKKPAPEKQPATAKRKRKQPEAKQEKPAPKKAKGNAKEAA